MRPTLGLTAALDEAAREINAPLGFDATLDIIVQVARHSLPGIDHVGISMATPDGRIETRSATDDLVSVLDQLQYDLGEGPCLQAMGQGVVVRVERIEQEERWPAFVKAARLLGLRSQLGIPLNDDERSATGLNMYSTSEDVIHPETEQMAELFATHAALAMGHARQRDHLQVALNTRKAIGIALGITMERLDIDEDTAFAYLTRVSARSERKLRDVAAAIVAEHAERVPPTSSPGSPG